MHTPQRRSRLHPRPKTTKVRGRTHALRITENDLAIFRILQRYRYLPVNFIHALLPTQRHYGKLQERLTDLTGHGYLARPERQFETYNAYYKKLTYTLGKLGHQLMEEIGEAIDIPVGAGNAYHHEVLTCLVIASMEISAKDYRFVHWPELLQQSRVPETTRQAANPFHLPLIGRQQKHQVPDGAPFCIAGEKLLCFPGIETDMGSEPLTGSRRVTIEKKFAGYGKVMHHRTYRAHYGMPTMLIPFVTTSETRMHNMMALLERMTEGKGCSYILFKHTPHLRALDRSPEPADLLSDAWRRVGHPPFDLQDQLGGGGIAQSDDSA